MGGDLVLNGMEGLSEKILCQCHLSQCPSASWLRSKVWLWGIGDQGYGN